MVGCKYVSAALLHYGNYALHLGLDEVDIVPELSVNSAVEAELVAVKLLKLKGIHTRLDFKRIEHFDTRFDNIGNKRLDKSAGMHFGNHSALVRPVDSIL